MEKHKFTTPIGISAKGASYRAYARHFSFALNSRRIAVSQQMTFMVIKEFAIVVQI
jgi:hypothetical protein